MYVCMCVCMYVCVCVCVCVYELPVLVPQVVVEADAGYCVGAVAVPVEV
jgi:hypothetical protein